MTLDSEDAVKKALGINSFREMSKEKMLAFAASMPDMANEVRLKLIEQIPGFQKFALDAINAAERTFKETTSNEDKRGERLHESMGDIRESIKAQLANPNISEEHARFLNDKLTETGTTEAESQKDSRAHDAKQADETRKAIVTLVGIGLVSAVILAGGKVMLGRGPQA
ncbi:hypothetical protein M2152_000951 [Microbacteriaceae bacterium SG_E_30_P1]|uniref:Uncharacterized protein n=1 Tax=Antiquaquibacter oligotrophicus TaxID=2880260 RepID=A0ABT6KLN8_9MICO|nr:hypothetical protein [Antiquaquibacter oligotrophicus]MDH6180769.1 hypothetical protein [Antiquaquibacter oligotrophicus]UDF13512.1 hypothetical protein LH407_01230 [Antiquaquibacter oligotrophicus]